MRKGPELTGKKLRGYYRVVRATVLSVDGVVVKDPPVELKAYCEKVTKAVYEAYRDAV